MPVLPNDRWERFCQNLIASSDWDVQGSYESAGYKASGESARSAGARLLQNVTVQERIAELQQERAERLQVTADDVVRGLLSEAKGEGPDTVSSSRIAAWDKLAKHLGLYEADNTQRKADDGQVIVIGGNPIRF